MKENTHMRLTVDFDNIMGEMLRERAKKERRSMVDVLRDSLSLYLKIRDFVDNGYEIEIKNDKTTRIIEFL